MGDRNNRLLLVFAILGVIFGSFKVIGSIIKTSFYSVYNTSFPFGVQHFIGPIALATEIVVSLYAIYYIYLEAHSYRVLKELNPSLDQLRANSSYQLLLNIVTYCFVGSFWFAGFLYIILNLQGFKRVLSLISLGIVSVGLIFILFDVAPKIKNIVRLMRDSDNISIQAKTSVTKDNPQETSNTHQVPQKSKPSFKLSKEDKFPHVLIALSIWFLSFITSWFVGVSTISSNGLFSLIFYPGHSPYIRVSFSNADPHNFSAKISYKDIQNNDLIPIKTTTPLLNYSFDIKQGNNTQLDDIRNDSQIAEQTIWLGQYLRQGTNYIVIQFQNGDGLNEKQYTLLYEIFKSSTGEFTAVQSSIQQRL